MVSNHAPGPLPAMLPDRGRLRDGISPGAPMASEDDQFAMVERAVRAPFADGMLDDVALAAIVTDANGAVTHWNKQAERLYGWPSAEAIGRPVSELVVPAETLNQSHQIMESLRAGERWRGTFAVRDRSGRVFTAAVIDAPIFDDEGNVTHVVGLSAEHAVEAATASPATSRVMPYLKATVFAALVVAVAATIERSNGTALTLLLAFPVTYAAWACGWRFATVLSVVLAAALVLVIFPHPRDPLDSNELTRLITYLIAAVLIIPIVHHARAAMVGVEDANGRLNILLRERSELVDELRSANDSKDEFLSLVSHEMKTPLTMIIGNAHVLRRSHGRLDAGEVEDSLDDIAESGERLDAIINDLLVLARLKQGAVLDMEPLVVRHLVESLVTEHRRQYPQRDLRVEETGGEPAVVAHEGYLRQALRNLLSNAEKYSPADQTIEIEIVRTDDAVRICVRDHGTGIPLDEQAAIFEPFYRSSSSQSAQGIGVGLTVFRRLIEAQHGSCWVRNHPEGGAEFGVSLPTEHSGEDPLTA